MKKQTRDAKPCAGCGAAWEPTSFGSRLGAHSPICEYAGEVLCPDCGHAARLHQTACRNALHPNPALGESVRPKFETVDSTILTDPRDRIAAAKSAAGPVEAPLPWVDADGEMNHARYCDLLKDLAKLTPGARRRILRGLMTYFEVGA